MNRERTSRNRGSRYALMGAVSAWSLVCAGAQGQCTPPMLDTLGAGAGAVEHVSASMLAMGRSNMFHMVNIANPASPVVGTGIELENMIFDIEVVGGMAYVTHKAALSLVDTANFAAPDLVRGHRTFGRPAGLAVRAGDVAVVPTSVQLAVYHNGQAASVDRGTDPAYQDVSLSSNGQIAYVAAHGSGPNQNDIIIFNVADPSAPFRAGAIRVGDNFTGARAVRVLGNMMYVWTESVTVLNSGLQVFDISNPLSPVFRGRVSVLVGAPERVRLEVVGTRVYAAVGSQGTKIIDVSNPLNPVLLGTASTPGDAIDVSVSGTIACVAEVEGGMAVRSVVNGASPALLSRSSDPPGRLTDIAMVGTTAHTAQGYLGLGLFNGASASNVLPLGTRDTTGFASDIVTGPNVDFIAHGDGISAINVSNTLAPTLTSTFTPAAGLTRLDTVAISGTRLFCVADDTNTFYALNAANPAAISTLGSLALGGGFSRTREIAVSGNRAVIARENGVSVVDISNLASPTLLEDFPFIPGAAVAIAPPYAYVMGGARVWIINLSTPVPVLEYYTFVAGNNGGVDIAIRGNFACVLTENDLSFVEIGDPLRPAMVERSFEIIDGHELAIANNIVYVADGVGGLKTYQIPTQYTPGFREEPRDTYTCLGNTVSLHVEVAANPGATFRWHRNGVAMNNGASGSGSVISGVTTRTLSIANARESDAAEYTCVATNSCGSRTTQPAALTVANPDYNLDGGADNSDVFDLANDIASGTQSFPPHSTDFNGDGSSDNSDVIALADVVAGGACP